ncbi:MAG: hypothetical protein H0V70_28790 [Ktedonobacteraceae bacterium]|nr:hypothetical protein [Ktedonobacteraceae bacterium]
MSKKTLLELRDAWGFTLFQLRHVMELQRVINVEHDPVYLALQGRLMGLEQAEHLLKGIYLLTGTFYRLEDIDIRVEEVGK